MKQATRPRVKKLKWVMTWWYERWEYQDPAGHVFGCVQKTGGAMRYPRYQPIEYLWFLGTVPSDPAVPSGTRPTQKEAKAALEQLYEQYLQNKEINPEQKT
jgi:hypothetical protein